LRSRGRLQLQLYVNKRNEYIKHEKHLYMTYSWRVTCVHAPPMPQSTNARLHALVTL